MFKRITADTLPDVMEFLLRESEINHFILGDIEVFGLDDPNITLWAAEPLSAVLLRYYGSYLLYAPAGADYGHAERLIKQYGFGALSGRPEYIQPLLSRLSDQFRLQTHVYMSLKPGGLKPAPETAETVFVDACNLEQYIAGIADLRRNIPEFTMALNVDAMREEVLLGCKRIGLILQDGKVASMAMTSVERDDAAMIVSVCTRNEYRGRGYAGAVTSALCRQLADEGKTALLFFDNLSAGRIYSSLGFRDIGRWCTAMFC